MPAVSSLAVVGLGSTPALAATHTASTHAAAVHAALHAPRPLARRALHHPAAKAVRPFLKTTPDLSPSTTTTPAHTYIVDTTADTVDATSGDHICADANGQCSLRAAVMEADSDTGLVRIDVPTGTYNLTIAPTSGDGPGNGDLDLFNLGGIELVGAGAATTTINASGISDRVISAGGPVLVSGLTITGGTTDNSTIFEPGVGGGVNVDPIGDVTLSNDVIDNNSASYTSPGPNPTTSGAGGGVFSTGTLWLENSTVDHNTAHNDGGGGAYLEYAATWSGGTVTGNTAASYGGGVYNDGPGADLTGVAVTANSAGGSGEGGGVYNDYQLSFTGGSIDGNYAYGGGGFYNDDIATLTGTEVNGNQSNAYDGGGIDNQDSLELSSVTVRSNTGAGYGGGIYNDGRMSATAATVSANAATVNGAGLYNSNDATFVGSTFTANHAATDGGGIYATGALTLKATDVTGNTSLGDGGGIYSSDQVIDNAGTITGNSAAGGGGGIFNSSRGLLHQVTVAGNTAPNGGGIDSGDGGAVYNTGNVDLTNDTVVANTASVNGGAFANDGGTLVATEATINANTAGTAGGALHNVFGLATFHSSIVTTNQAAGTPGNCSTVDGGLVLATYSLDSGGSCGFTATGDISNEFGMHIPLGHYGGPTETERLQSVSPAINSAGTTCATSFDQRGVSRPQDGGCDMGALERISR